jgi:hypothetical protein|tara:strand:- start:2145 stop:8369 length:6225 start_codon:yes stop_codon:yes gene_type:complete
MACKFRPNKQGDIIGAVAKNGEPSVLFSELVQYTGNIDRAMDFYEGIYSQEFKNIFGDFETDTKNETSFRTDENGEPKLMKGDGYYYVIDKDGNQRPLENLKIRERESSFNGTYEMETMLLDTAVSFINDHRKENDNINISQLFNANRERGDRGILGERILSEAFEGIPNTEEGRKQAVDLYDTFKSDGLDAMLGKLPAGVTYKKIGPVFMSMYDKWYDVVDPGTGNTIRKGWRSMIQDKLTEHGMKLRDDVGDIVDMDDTPVRIHDISRLEENPRDKLTSQVKSVLYDIRDNNNPNALGYITAIPLDQIYSDINEASVDQITFAAMMLQLNNMAKYKPYLEPVVNKLNTLKTDAQAAFFANFANAYKNFLQFDAKKIVTRDPNTGEVIAERVQHRMYPSGVTSIAKRYRNAWKAQSVENEIPNPQALYKTNEKGQLFIPEAKQKKINSLWEKVNKIRRNNPAQYELSEQDVNNLGEYLYELGIQYGSNIDAHNANLQKYFNIGVPGPTGQLQGFPLFIDFAFKKQKDLQRLNNLVQDNKNIYEAADGLIKNLAAIGPLFDVKAAESFFSGAGKTYYPINKPTPLDDIINKIQSPEGLAYLESLKEDKLISPGLDPKYDSILLRSLLYRDGKAREQFNSEIFDSVKGVGNLGVGDGYSDIADKQSLIARLNAFANNDNKNFTKMALSTQADRKRLDFITVRRLQALGKDGMSNMSNRNIIKSFIIQDLTRIKQAKDEIQKAKDDNSIKNLIEGYHYRAGTNPLTDTFADYKGSVFTQTQLFGLQDRKVDKINNLSDVIENYVTADPNYMLTKEANSVDTLLNEEIDKIEKRLERYEEGIENAIATFDISKNQDLHPNARKDNFIKDFVFHDFVYRIEAAKLFRGGFSYAKSSDDYYKRMGLINSPGTKLFIVGDGTKTSDYGMTPTYKEIVFNELDFFNKEDAAEVATTMQKNLEAAGVPTSKAKDIADNYRSVAKTDAQGVITLDMYRRIQMGLGQWSTPDENAYKRYKQGQPYDRPIYPVKPYHEEIRVKDGKSVLYMNKNSYMVLTRELAEGYPVMQKLLNAMERDGIDVANESNATKGARQDVKDIYTDPLTDLNPVVMNSRQLRLPQMLNQPEKNQITFSRQIRKNLISTIQPDATYNVQGNNLSGEQLYDRYQKNIVENIKEDTIKLENELGLTAVKNAIKTNGLRSDEHRDAKLAHLKKMRDTFKNQVKDKGLPNVYLEGLNIVPNGPFDWRFEVPLAFPNYQSKYEQIFFSLFNNGIFTQKIKGQEVAQIAELGGHETDGDLKMFDGTNPAEVRIKASTLGLEPGTDISTIKDKKRLEFIGYRIPNQGKSSFLPMKVIGFLPESHQKAIMVPGGITKQMGSDFDIDKLNLVFREYGDNLTDRQIRDQEIFDIMQSILMNPVHLEEVVTPLDSPRLENKAAELNPASSNSVDYNNPLSEVDMEQKNKAGIALRGLWANILAGHNVSAAAKLKGGGLVIDNQYAPIIDGIEYSEVGIEREDGITIDQNAYNEASISAYLSAAVDAAKKPVQIDINDNKFTVPVAGLMLSVGIPVETVIDFLTQPSIVESIQDAKNNGYNPGQLKRSVKKILRDYKGRVSNTITDMSTQSLKDKELRTTEDSFGVAQAAYLNNFLMLHKAGRSLQTAFKVITPDNLDNVNEMSALRGWLDTEAEYLNDSTSNIILGAEEFITSDLERSSYPIMTAYRGIFDTVLNAAEQAGFINNRPAFFGFKQQLKRAVGKTSFNAATQKFIDRQLFLDLMLKEGSPLQNFASDRMFDYSYRDGKNNIATRLRSLQENNPDNINDNIFFKKLQPSEDNNDLGQTLFTIELNTTFDMSTHEKNAMTEAFKELLQSSNIEIKNFAKELIAHQLQTKGFTPGRGTFMDLIPVEAFTTDLLNPGKQTPIQFFQTESRNTLDSEYFSNFVHKFVRNFGTTTVGGQSILPGVNFKNIQNNLDNQGQVTLNPKANPNILHDAFGYVSYFVTYPKGQAPKIFVRVADNTYTELQPLGIKGRFNEVGNKRKDGKSMINKQGTTALPGPNTKMKVEEKINLPESVTAPIDEVFKICKI